MDQEQKVDLEQCMDKEEQVEQEQKVNQRGVQRLRLVGLGGVGGLAVLCGIAEVGVHKGYRAKAI